ncbi:MAG: hypothetical protein V1936_01475 [Patescibacteria group bacterium]
METLRKFFAIRWQRLYFFWIENCTHLRPRDLKTIVAKKMPVVLISGIYTGGRSLLPLKQFLESQGWPVYLPAEKKNFARLPILAKQLERRIREIPAKKVQIVAHSMGGLTALWALQDPKLRARVAQVISLGAPFNGCILGSLAFWERKRNQKYLALHSAAIKKMQANRAACGKIRALHAKFDELVFPESTTILKGARENTELQVIGHAGLLLAKKTWRAIAKRLLK